MLPAFDLFFGERGRGGSVFNARVPFTRTHFRHNKLWLGHSLKCIIVSLMHSCTNWAATDKTNQIHQKYNLSRQHHHHQQIENIRMTFKMENLRAECNLESTKTTTKENKVHREPAVELPFPLLQKLIAPPLERTISINHFSAMAGAHHHRRRCGLLHSTRFAFMLRHGFHRKRCRALYASMHEYRATRQSSNDSGHFLRHDNT